MTIENMHIEDDAVSLATVEKYLKKNYSPIGHPRVLNLANTSADLVKFRGGFEDGDYLYLAPMANYKIAKIKLNDFSTVTSLDFQTTVKKLAFTSGGTYEVQVGDTITGATSGETATVVGITKLTSGSWAGGDAAGSFYLQNQSGTFQSENLNVGANSNVATIAGDSTNSDLKGFWGAFTDGIYGYFVPYYNTNYFGKVVRVDLSDFSTVRVLDLASTDADLEGFCGGFTDGVYGYFVPIGGGADGKVARVLLSDFSTVSVLNLASTDADLAGFKGGFTDGVYGYFVPHYNTDFYGKLARVLLSDFSTVSVLNLASTDADLVGFVGGFINGNHAYLVPHRTDTGDNAHGKVPKIDLTSFTVDSFIDLTNTDADLKGFSSGFTDGRYGYFCPDDKFGYSGKIGRIDLSDFSTVAVLNLESFDSDLKGFYSSLTDGKFGYFIPNTNGVDFGKLVRIKLKINYSSP